MQLSNKIFPTCRLMVWFVVVLCLLHGYAGAALVPTPTACTDVDFAEANDDDSYPEAEPIYPFQISDIHYFCTNVDQDWLYLDVLANETYQIYTLNLGTNTDPQLQVIEYISGVPLIVGADLDSYDGISPMVEAFAPRTTTWHLRLLDEHGSWGSESYYYVLVDNFTKTPTGTPTRLPTETPILSWTPTRTPTPSRTPTPTASPTPCSDVDPNEGLGDDSWTDAEEIVPLATPVIHYFCYAGDEDWHYVDVFSGLNYRIHSLNVGQQADPQLVVVEYLCGAEVVIGIDKDSYDGVSPQVDGHALVDTRWHLKFTDEAGQWGSDSFYHAYVSIITNTPTPTGTPTPSRTPTGTPSLTPTRTPTRTPTTSPTATPSSSPTMTPSATPSGTPTLSPTATDTATPSQTPTLTPTLTPTNRPTDTPSATPSLTPTTTPTGTPSTTPSLTPTLSPTLTPSLTPTRTPTSTPSDTPTALPTETRTATPTYPARAPYTTQHTPAPREQNVAPNITISVHFKDDEEGVDTNTIVVAVNNIPVQTQLTELSGKRDVLAEYQPPQPFSEGDVIKVTLDAKDLAQPPNVMPQFGYVFQVASQFTPTPLVKPFVLLAGYMDTSLHYDGGAHFKMLAMVSDPHNQPFFEPKVYVNGVEVGVTLSVLSVPDGLYQLHIGPVSGPLPPGRSLLEIRATTHTASSTDFWPYFTVSP